MTLDQIDAECFAPVSHHLHVIILVGVSESKKKKKQPSLPGPLCV